jgi:hypothetical protein
MRIVVIANSDLLDENGLESEEIGRSFCNTLYGGQWVQTSYNANTRGKYAAIGDTYNQAEDIFISAQPFTSWLRNGSYWEPPTPKPSDGKSYEWNEDSLAWVKIG